MSSRPARPLLPESGPYLGDAEAAVTMQVAIHLNDVEHEVFSRWLASTAVAVDSDNPHLESSEAISAMIRTSSETPLSSSTTSKCANG